MHRKFRSFLLIVFFLFSFFPSVWEFCFIERMGTHSKKNPDFIIIYYIDSVCMKKLGICDALLDLTCCMQENLDKVFESEIMHTYYSAAFELLNQGTSV